MIRFMSSPLMAWAALSYICCQVPIRWSFFKNGEASSSVAYSKRSGAY